MTIYQPSIPTGLVDLDLDYINIQNNFSQLDTTYGKDHVKYSVVTANGYHKAIHMVPVSTTASNMPNNQPINGYTATPGFGQLFDAQINDGIGSPDEALFYLSGGNKLTQLTRNFQPVANTNGYTFLPGGLIFQWGQINGTHGNDNHFTTADTNQTLTFSTNNIAFPKNCFSVWTQLAYTSGNIPAGSSSAQVTINKSLTNTAFIWSFQQASGASITRFYWFALGN